jgi:UrcA family protein
MNRPLISAMATIALVAVGQSATAQTLHSAKTKQMTISFGDLNVHSEVGAGVLLNRMRMASRIVCGPEPMFLDLGGRHFYDACRKNALDNAVSDVGAPEVVEIYRGNAAATRTASS